MEEHHKLTPSVNVTPFSIAVGITNFVDGHMRLVMYEGNYQAKESFRDETKRLVIKSAIDELDACKAKLQMLYNDCVPTEPEISQAEFNKLIENGTMRARHGLVTGAGSMYAHYRNQDGMSDTEAQTEIFKKHYKITS